MQNQEPKERRNIFQRFDDGVMYGINKLVRAYNWTTGKTKADLANKLMFTTPISWAMYLSFDRLIEKKQTLNFFDVFLEGLLILSTYFFQRENKKLEERELRALENSIRDFSVERIKNMAKRSGYLLAGFTGVSSPEKFLGETSLDGLSFVGFFEAYSLSNLVMAADYVPPGKSVVKRAKEYLSAKFSELKERYVNPIPQPAFAPIPVGTRRESLENYVLR